MNDFPLQVEEAQRRIAESIALCPFVRLPLDACDGLRLAEAVTATSDVPAFDRSMMDGFAVRAADTAAASPKQPAQLAVVDELPAGAQPKRGIGPGEAVRIMTGAMIPPGADAVCRFEATSRGFTRGIEAVDVLVPVKPGENIDPCAADIRHGDIVAASGRKIGPAEIAVLATFGHTHAAVRRRPVAAVLSCGTELKKLGGEPPLPGQIRDSNSHMIAAMIRQAGGEARLLPPVADDIDAIYASLLPILDEVDLVVTAGGVSVGDYDLTANVYDRLGAETMLWKVLLRPGSPFRFAKRGALPFFGLSGNPAAAFVNAQLFVLPAVRAMLGDPEPFPRYAQAVLCGNAVRNTVKQTRFLRSTACLRDGRLEVNPAAGQSSGMIGSLIGANCLIKVPGGCTVEAGETVEILLFDEVLIR